MLRRPTAARGLAAALGGIVYLSACGDDPTGVIDREPDFVTSLTVTPNPSGYAPLTAEVTLTTSRSVDVELEIAGRVGAPALRHRFEGVTGPIDLPVLGLYAGTANVVTLRFFDGAGALLGQAERTITTLPAMADLPDIDVEVVVPGALRPGMNLVSYFGHDSQLTPQRPFVFDAQGAVRWYLDFTDHPTLGRLFYDNGVERLANGNLYFGDRSSGRIVEMDMLGRVVSTWSLPGYAFHHQVLERPGGNFLVTVDRLGAPTVEDVVIEIDRASGAIVREWDLNGSLDNTRRAWETDLADLDVDWFHANGLAYDPSDDAIIVSGRTQGTVKLTQDNEVVWILAPHRGWGLAGDGTDLRTRLLQPLDGEGRPIEDPDVLDGRSVHPEFEWPWYQHAPEVLPDGTLLLFDNGDNRGYTGQRTYSRAVLYRIDPVGRTVQQVWQYGKERGSATYSRIVSDVDYHADEDNVVFMPGAVAAPSGARGIVVEVDRASRDVVFEATLVPPVAPFGIAFHRVERLPLYPPG